MNTLHFDRFAPVIRSLSAAELSGKKVASLTDRLTLARDGGLRVCYAPFEFINPCVKLVIVGITPGLTQMCNALTEARKQLDRGSDTASVLIASKRAAGFSGTMRPNLISLLNCVGIHRWLGIDSCDALFGSSAHLLQTASVLRNPVFVDGKNYNGTPDMTRHPLLREQLLSCFGEDVRSFTTAAFVPLGDKVAKALHFLADNRRLEHAQILEGLPHPSGANAERIAFFLGRKSRAELSPKTNPDKIEQARDQLSRRIAALA